MLKIRLARFGRKNQPSYKIVVANSRSPRDSRYIDVIGAYNPLMKTDNPKNKIKLDLDKFNKWTKCGAQPTEIILRFLARK